MGRMMAVGVYGFATPNRSAFFRPGCPFFLLKFNHLIDRSLGLFTNPVTHWCHLDRVARKVNRMTDYPCHARVAGG